MEKTGIAKARDGDYKPLMPRRRKMRYSWDQWAVHRERLGLPIDAPAPTDDPPPPPLRELVAKVLARCRLDENLWLQEAAAEWPDLVGPALAQHSRPGGCENGVLCIYASHSAWLSELERQRRGPLLEKLRTRFGLKRIRELRVRLDPDPPSR